MSRSPVTVGILLMAALALAGVVMAGSEEPAGHHRLVIQGLRFEPGTLTLAPGDSVTWINEDVVPHTVTAVDGRWDSGELATGEAWTLVVGPEEAVGFLCRYHPPMRGMLAPAP